MTFVAFNVADVFTSLTKDTDHFTIAKKFIQKGFLLQKSHITKQIFGCQLKNQQWADFVMLVTLVSEIYFLLKSKQNVITAKTQLCIQDNDRWTP